MQGKCENILTYIVHACVQQHLYLSLHTSTNDSGIAFDNEGLFICQHMDGQIQARHNEIHPALKTLA